MSADAYTALHRTVLAAVISTDPMQLAGPGNDLADDYDAEAREIARRLVHAGCIEDASASEAVSETFTAAFGEPLPAERVTSIVAGIVSNETGLAVRDEVTSLTTHDAIAEHADESP